MRDDFAALDLFSSAAAKKKRKKSARKQQPLAALKLIAKIKKKQKADAVDVASLQGWGVSLSWPAPRPEVSDDASQAYPLGYSS